MFSDCLLRDVLAHLNDFRALPGVDVGLALVAPALVLALVVKLPLRCLGTDVGYDFRSADIR